MSICRFSGSISPQWPCDFRHWASIHQRVRHITERYRKVSKLQNFCLELSYHCTIWQAPSQQYHIDETCRIDKTLDWRHRDVCITTFDMLIQISLNCVAEVYPRWVIPDSGIILAPNWCCIIFLNNCDIHLRLFQAICQLVEAECRIYAPVN